MSLVERIANRVEELYEQILSDREQVRMLLKSDASLAKHLANVIRKEFADAEAIEQTRVEGASPTSPGSTEVGGPC